MINVYLTDTITHELFKGRSDSFGSPSYTSTTRRAYIDYKVRHIPGPDGATLIAVAKLYLKPITIVRDNFSSRGADTIAYQDRITFDGKDHRILWIAKGKDFSTRFLQVYVQ